jgi:hypothetical protein
MIEVKEKIHEKAKISRLITSIDANRINCFMNHTFDKDNECRNLNVV